MKQYKLIKEYPGSPKLGCIIIYTDNQWLDSYPNNEHDQMILLEWVLGYPEYWQEIKSKEWEILELENKHGAKLTSDLGAFEILCEKVNLDKGFKITKIKRLSDNVEFKIGDKTDVINNFIKEASGDILGFYIASEKLYAKINNMGGFNINNINHAKQPLFKTEDGIDIYKGDKYFLLQTSNYDLIDYIYNANSLNKGGNKHHLRFSTKEAAEEYAIMNKPCLSLKEIEEHWNNYITNFFIKRLRKTVIDKLKL